MLIIQHIQTLIGTLPDGKFGLNTRYALVNLLKPNYFQNKFKETKFEEILQQDASEIKGKDLLEFRKQVGNKGIEKMFKLGSEYLDEFTQKELVNQSAKDYGLNSKDLDAIIAVESGGNINAVSPSGPMGIMQLSHWIYGNNQYGGAINPFNPEQAIDR